jgi:hypothetical protein
MSRAWFTIVNRSCRHCASLCALGFVLLVATPAARADRAACLQAHERGQLLRLRGHFTEARAQLASCAEASCPKLLRDDCQTLLTELDAQRAAVVFVVVDRAGNELTDVRVFADDALLTDAVDGRAVPLDPGTYRLRFEVPGHGPTHQTVAIRDGERSKMVRAQLDYVVGGGETERDRRTGRGPIVAYALGGAALAVLASGVGLGVAGKHELDRLDGSCGSNRDCGNADTERGRRLYLGADVAFGIGGALAVAATTLFIVDRVRSGGETRRLTARLDGQLARDGAGLSLRGTF